MKTIENRKDVSQLVNQFYSKIRKDDLLGPIFNGSIPEEKWPHHLEKLTDFWETNLFGIAKFKGNPTLKHRIVDIQQNNTITENHFNHWLSIWFATIDEIFEGRRADMAKDAATRMGRAQFNMILHFRDHN